MNPIGHYKMMNTDKDPDSIVLSHMNDSKQNHSAFDTGTLRKKTTMTRKFSLEEFELYFDILKNYSK